jgi:phage terminase large subunit
MNEDVVFSDKYQPLFDILICWDEIKRIQSLPKQTYNDILDLIYFQELANVDTVLLSGGRDSGKSFSLSTFNVLAVADYNHRILYTRQTMSSTDSSISTALSNRMELLELDHEFEYANNNYTLKDGRNGKITITGQKTSVGTQTAKLKSLEDYSIFETDEGEELESYDGWVKIKRSMRANDVQCLSIIAFNPPTREHWIAEEFYNGVPDGFNGVIGNVLYIHTTYIDNGKDNMAIHNWNEYEDLRISYELYNDTPKDLRSELDSITIKKFKKYKYDILGAFKLKAEGVIYEDWIVGDFDTSLPYVHGLDFGSNDPDACVKIAVDETRKLIYWDEMFFQNEMSSNQLSAILDSTVGKHEIIIADSAGKRTIRDLWDEGFEIEKCRSKKVWEDIKMLQGYTMVVTPRSKNVQKAFNNYVWAVKKAGVPNHDWSDLMDAGRYGAMYIINGVSNTIL